MKLLEWDMFLELAWNLGLVTFKNNQKEMDESEVALVLVHEIGHNCLQPASIEGESLTPLEVNNTLSNFESTPEANRNNVSKNKYTERVKMRKLQGEPEANRKLDVLKAPANNCTTPDLKTCNGELYGCKMKVMKGFWILCVLH